MRLKEFANRLSKQLSFVSMACSQVVFVFRNPSCTRYPGLFHICEKNYTQLGLEKKESPFKHRIFLRPGYCCGHFCYPTVSPLLLLSGMQGNQEELKLLKSYVYSGPQKSSVWMVQNEMKVVFKRTKYKYNVVKNKDNEVLSA